MNSSHSPYFFLPLVALSLSCASSLYETRAYPLTESPAIPWERAIQICELKAEIAGGQARNSMQPNHQIQRTKSQGLEGLSETFNNIGSEYGQRAAAENEYYRTYQLTRKLCLAEAGWGLEKVCVDNCP